MKNINKNTNRKTSNKTKIRRNRNRDLDRYDIIYNKYILDKINEHKLYNSISNSDLGNIFNKIMPSFGNILNGAIDETLELSRMMSAGYSEKDFFPFFHRIKEIKKTIDKEDLCDTKEEQRFCKAFEAWPPSVLYYEDGYIHYTVDYHEYLDKGKMSIKKYNRLKRRHNFKAKFDLRSKKFGWE